MHKYFPKSSGQYLFLTRHASSSGSGHHNASWSPQRWWFCSLSQPWSPPSAEWVWRRRERSNNTSEVQNSEDNNRFRYSIAAIKQQNVFLLLVLFRFQADVNNLQDVVVGTELQSTNINLDVFLQEVLSQLPYLFWPGCTPHQGLSVRLRGGREY